MGKKGVDDTAVLEKKYEEQGTDLQFQNSFIDLVGG